MPTYEYACRDCGHHLEAVQSFSDDPLAKCPACGGRLRKKFSAAGIIFKGSGYYVTDSRAQTRDAAKAGSTSSDKPGTSDKSAPSDTGTGSAGASSDQRTSETAGSGASGGSKTGGSKSGGSKSGGSKTGGAGTD